MTTTAAVKLPRASRSMALQFGMFRVEVGMAPLFASDTSGPKAHKSCAEHGAQVKQAWYCEAGDHYPTGGDIESAYDHNGERIVLSAPEVSMLEAERDGIVTLKRSCPVAEIDPSYYEKTYLLWPKTGTSNEQAYQALSTAMRNKDCALIGQVVVTKTDRMLVLRWSSEHGAVVGHFCNFAANMKHEAVELVRAAEASWAPPVEGFVTQAEGLIGMLLGSFDPGMIEDTYSGRLTEALDAATGSAAKVDEAPSLMDALATSMAAA